MKRRRAVSLVELLLAMSACTVILTLSAALVHRMLHAQSRTRAFFDAERTALRLSRQFRRDVEEATSATTPNEVTAEGVFLTLEMPGDRTVEYRRTSAAISRIELENGNTPSRDAFVFPTDREIIVRQEANRVLALSVTAATEKEPADDRLAQDSAYQMSADLHVEARLNRLAAIAASEANENHSR
jgi:hypothetical protein